MIELPDKAPPLADHPDEVVRLLAHALDRALLGDVVGVGLVMVLDAEDGHNVSIAWCMGDATWAEMHTGAAILAHRLLTLDDDK